VVVILPVVMEQVCYIRLCYVEPLVYTHDEPRLRVCFHVFLYTYIGWLVGLLFSL
jgi:hypothetical protein